MSSFEAHVTLEPFLDDNDRAIVDAKAQAYAFRTAKLFMEKTAQRDAFCTGHSVCRNDLTLRLIGFIKSLQRGGYEVRRYKIEEVVVDSRILDTLELLK